MAPQDWALEEWDDTNSMHELIIFIQITQMLEAVEPACLTHLTSKVIETFYYGQSIGEKMIEILKMIHIIDWMQA